MYLNEFIRTDCAKCMVTCPVHAIYIERATKHVAIDQEPCVDCRRRWPRVKPARAG
jgi:NAD-dependent dihydropyrimidine dehydrogenase PreA subunit